MRKILLAAGALLAAIAPTFVLTASAEAAAPVRVVRWVDGDTVVTTNGEVRLIGVDTPERGHCGYRASTRHALRIAPVGSIIRLVNPSSVQNSDRYGRLLRFVDRGRKDISAAQITAGARARYDSRDGYAWHPRQAGYHRLDARFPNYRCAASGSSGSGGSGGSGGSSVYGAVAPSGWGCPSNAPIKGNASSMIYHRPGQAYYAATNPEECFRSAASAEAAGYRAAKI